MHFAKFIGLRIWYSGDKICTVITLREIHKSFGAVDVLRGVDWTIPRGARIGLIGLNGSGKSTLLLIIKGDLEPDSGEVLRPPGLKIGYLPQEPDLTATDFSVLEESLKGREDLLLMEKRIRQLEDEMKEARGEKLDILIEEHSRLHQEFLKSGGYALKSEALKVLKGLGFSDELIEKKVSELSGGFRARLELAKILLAGPDVLLLDEPTNNLDIPSLVWLQGYLRAFRGTYIVVSHDRYFLDSVVESIAEIERGKIYVYSGNYSSYVSAKRQREEAIKAQWKEYEREKEKLQRFIERYRAYKDKANLVRDRKRKLEKLEPPPDLPPQRDFRIKVRNAGRLPKTVVKMSGVVKGFGGQPVLRGIDLEIHRGDRLALMGPNGKGKSTLLSIIAGKLRPDSGEVLVSDGVVLGYFSQSRVDDLDPELTVLETLEREAQDMTLWEVRRLLGAFLFSDDDVFKRVKDLSGGEKARLALAVVFARPRNFLLLDEPTNHLDIPTREALEEALLEFEGAYLVVSHDRYFVEKTADRLLFLDEELTFFHGRYSEYEKHISLKPLRGTRERSTGKREKRTDPLRVKKRRIKKLREELEKLEEKLTDLEGEKSELERELARPDLYKDGDKAREKVNRYEGLKLELQRLYRKWEELLAELEREEKEYEDERAKRISR